MTDHPERFDKEALRREIVEAGGEDFRHRDSGRCPFHEDHSPSGSIHRGEDGVYRFKCHSPSCGFQGDIFDVQAKAKGVEVSEVLPRDDSRPPVKSKSEKTSRTFSTLESLKATIEGRIEGVYEYPGEGPIVIRFCPPGSDSKRFMQARRTTEGFAFGAPPKPHPFYRSDQLDGTKKIIVVEGEKCVHALSRFGYPVTCWPGGCKAVKHADARFLAGRSLCLWPDNDQGGIDAMKVLAERVLEIDSKTSIRVIDPTRLNLEKAGDCADLIEEMVGLTDEEKRTELHKVFAGAHPFGLASDLQSHVERMIRGEYRPVHFPFQALSYHTNALLPGNILILAGGPGVSKSLFLVQCLAHWNEIGDPIAALLLEGDEEFHLLRMLAQIAKEPGITDPGWVETNEALARAILNDHRDFIESMGSTLTSGVAQYSDHASVLRWMEEKAKMGARIIVVDPITLLEHPGKDQHIADRDFMKGIQAICREYGCSFIGVSHPKKEWEKPSLNNLAGGTAYSRFSDSVFWVSFADDYYTISSNAGDIPIHVERVVSILKSRNGRGANLEIGFRWDKESLSFHELGVILKKAKLPSGVGG
ncbi:MAG: AAA family ATPase [Candidatus Omnitrophica bacterium]|nr:AAA family ATPase [Candidatus Omnitrophota bacterium]